MTTTTEQKHDVYKTNQRESQTAREIEARALLSCASRLEAARKPEAGLQFYTEALKQNQHLWTIFQVALCDPENPLPVELKIVLLNLSRYVDKISFRAIGQYTPNLLDGLIDINRRIAAGLSAKPKTAETQTSVPSPNLSPALSVMTTA